MALTPEQIEKLASRKDVRKIAVKNFLGTLGQEGPAGRSGALHNLYADAASYRWNQATIKAIESGINQYFGR